MKLTYISYNRNSDLLLILTDFEMQDRGNRLTSE